MVACRRLRSLELSTTGLTGQLLFGLKQCRGLVRSLASLAARPLLRRSSEAWAGHEAMERGAATAHHHHHAHKHKQASARHVGPVPYMYRDRSRYCRDP